MEPLFDSEDFVYYDQYQDGDPYGDEHYIEIFRSILEAVHEQKSVQILYQRKMEQKNGRVVIQFESVFAAG